MSVKAKKTTQDPKDPPKKARPTVDAFGSSLATAGDLPSLARRPTVRPGYVVLRASGGGFDIPDVELLVNGAPIPTGGRGGWVARDRDRSTGYPAYDKTAAEGWDLNLVLGTHQPGAPSVDAQAQAIKNMSRRPIAIFGAGITGLYVCVSITTADTQHAPDGTTRIFETYAASLLTYDSAVAATPVEKAAADARKKGTEAARTAANAIKAVTSTKGKHGLNKR